MVKYTRASGLETRHLKTRIINVSGNYFMLLSLYSVGEITAKCFSTVCRRVAPSVPCRMGWAAPGRWAAPLRQCCWARWQNGNQLRHCRTRLWHCGRVILFGISLAEAEVGPHDFKRPPMPRPYHRHYESIFMGIYNEKNRIGLAYIRVSRDGNATLVQKVTSHVN